MLQRTFDQEVSSEYSNNILAGISSFNYINSAIINLNNEFPDQRPQENLALPQVCSNSH